MWAYESVFYQIYPLGFCGAPFENDQNEVPRIRKVINWIEHIKKVGANAIYFSPVFESDTHGYNTRDYKKIDCRLGSNDDFKDVCNKLHQNGIKVVLDGVFNHVGRGFPKFQDVIKNREASQYLNWFNISLDGNSDYNDGLWYEGWEGHYDLVKLNLRNREVVDYLLNCVKFWIDEFDIDGIRLDVAYCLEPDFVRELRQVCDAKKSDFFLVGEMLHGDYKRLMNDSMLHSATNYECYKGLYSSFNCMNMFEIMHSLLRQFGPEEWTLYKGCHLLNFVDNHDVSRIATILNNPKHLPLIYTTLFGMPGIPSIYYGSEWGAAGNKSDGDPALRVSFEKPQYNELTALISKLAQIKKSSNALNYGGFNKLLITNSQFVFERCTDGETVLVGANATDNEFFASFGYGKCIGTNLLTDESIEIDNGFHMQPYSYFIIKI